MATTITPEKLTKLLEQGRKSAWSSWGPAQWQAVLEQLGYTVAIEKERTTVVSFTATKDGDSFTENKREGYRRIVFYDLCGWFIRRGGPDACAKAAGLPTLKEAAQTKKQRKGESDVGVCQCCFNGFKLVRLATALHGYQRPGCGYILGRCRGAQAVPYEISCELTKSFKKELEGARANAEKYVADLKADKVPALSASVRTGKRVPHPKYRGHFTDEHKTISVPLGQAEIPNPFTGEGYYNSVPSYDKLRDIQISETESEIFGLTGTIQFLDEKITSWKFVLLPGFEAYIPKA